MSVNCRINKNRELNSQNMSLRKKGQKIGAARRAGFNRQNACSIETARQLSNFSSVETEERKYKVLIVQNSHDSQVAQFFIETRKFRLFFLISPWPQCEKVFHFSRFKLQNFTKLPRSMILDHPQYGHTIQLSNHTIQLSNS